jgi:hypothetical protein
MCFTFFLDPRRGLAERSFAHVIEQRRGHHALHLHVAGIIDATAGRVPIVRRRGFNVPMSRYIFQIGRFVIVQRPSQTALGRKEGMIIVRFKLACVFAAQKSVPHMYTKRFQANNVRSSVSSSVTKCSKRYDNDALFYVPSIRVRPRALVSF